MDLTAYLHPGWAPLIRPAPATRPWMDNTPEAFAYRCLPLNIANAHGWEVLNPHGVAAIWNGGTGVDAVAVRPDDGAVAERLPVSIFGQGVLTFHVEAILRTPPGWSLWVGGSPNRQKDAIAPLGGIIETDWSPFTFTMNWRFTRPGQWIRFEAMEPFCFFFPVERAAIEAFEPAFAPLGADPATEARFKAWSQARDAFHQRMQREPPAAPADKWQKHYYRGVDVAGEALTDDHRAKLRMKGFDRTAAPHLPAPPPDDAGLPQPSRPASADAEVRALRLALAKREWLLEAVERQRDLAPRAVGVERRYNIDANEFLERYYALNRPVILTGETAGWPALKLWTPEYLKAKLGAGNDADLTAYNAAGNREALAPLNEDLGFIDKLLDAGAPDPHGMMWIGPTGAFTAMHQDLTNNLIVQIVGRKRFLVLPPSEAGRVYNDIHVFSRVADFEDPRLDRAAFPRLAGARGYPIVLEPGEALFMPFGWWRQVRSLDFSVAVTHTNFRWPNQAYVNYPAG